MRKGIREIWALTEIRKYQRSQFSFPYRPALSLLTKYTKIDFIVGQNVLLTVDPDINTPYLLMPLYGLACLFCIYVQARMTNVYRECYPTIKLKDDEIDYMPACVNVYMGAIVRNDNMKGIDRAYMAFE